MQIGSLKELSSIKDQIKFKSLMPVLKLSDSNESIAHPRIPIKGFFTEGAPQDIDKRDSSTYPLNDEP